ncbi:MAG: rhamnogalacturonan acetylesterase [Nibricoccus sp.]
MKALRAPFYFLLKNQFCAVALLAVTATRLVAGETENPARKFSFAPGAAPAGFTSVTSDSIYSDNRGFGFEAGSTTIAKTDTKSPGGGFCTSDKPFYFSAALPEGNYRVTVTLGDPAGESDTTVKAELRRLMLQQVKTAKGEIVTRSFIVNIRTPHIENAPDDVALKPREKTMEIWAWDNRLTLEFNGTRPCLSTVEIARADDVPTVYLTGDSTVCDQPREPWASWGQMLTRFFRPDIAIANHAQSGEALRSSRRAHRFEKIFSTLKKGDFVIIQFGHNDEKEKGEGVGAFTTYKKSLEQLVDEVRENGGTPIVVTPMHRRTFDESGKIKNSHGDYPEAVRQVAREKSVTLVDLHAMSQDLYEALGAEKSAAAFATNAEGKVDGTHHNNYGAYILAKCVAKGIAAAQPDLAKHLAVDFSTFNPAKPDPVETFKIPASPLVDVEKPYGN